jgi:4-amino-4-deoxychorismate lyase
VGAAEATGESDGMPMILVDGLPANAVPADDRGFTYGDGVFRTLAMRNGRARWWPEQYAKLAADCGALRITAPAESDLRRDLQTIAAQLPDCALRITVTRGSGGRGYAVPDKPQSRRVVSANLLPQYPAHWPEQGVNVRICELRLAAQSRLAGIKHLNRLENVLARAEWHDPAIAEGLLLDETGNVIEGTRCNVFMVEDGALVTPDLSRCGVAGVTRDLVIAAAERNGLRCQIGAINQQRLEAATEIFLVNSLIGVWPVAALEQRRWSDFKIAPLVRKWLDALDHPLH